MTAAALLLANAWLACLVFPLIRTEGWLRRAEEACRACPERGLRTLLAAGTGRSSERQRALALAMAGDAVSRMRGDSLVLTRVGRHQFDPGKLLEPYVTSRREVTFTFEIPEALRPLRPDITVSSRGRPLTTARLSADASQGRCEVPLENVDELTVDVDLVCALGGFGSVTLPVARGLLLELASRGPRLRLGAGGEARPLKGGGVTPVIVAPGTPIRIDVKDEQGVRSLAWRVDGEPRVPFDWSPESRDRFRSVQLPDDLTATPSSGRLIELEALNGAGMRTAAGVQLRVRATQGPRIASVRLDGRSVPDGGVIHAGRRALALLVVLAEGEVAEDLAVTWDGRPVEATADGRQVTATLPAETEGERFLRITVAGEQSLGCSVRSDWTAPTVAARLEHGAGARNLDARVAPHDATIGAVVVFTIADAGCGLDAQGTALAVDGAALEEIVAPKPSNGVSSPSAPATRRFRCVARGTAVVRVSAVDLAGNRAPAHEFRILAADPPSPEPK